jgi:hypothetical protein
MEYAFKVIKTGEIVRYDMKMSEYDAFKKDNPHLERYHETAPPFKDGDGSSTSGFVPKLDNGFKEVLSKIAEAHPASELSKNSDVHRKSIKEIKTRRIMTKYAEKSGIKGVKF